MIPTKRSQSRFSWLLVSVLGLATAATLGAQGIPHLLPFNRTGDLFLVDTTSDSVWRMQDLNLDGDFNDAGELIDFYNDVTGSIALGNNAGVAVGHNGTLYVCDSSEDIVLALLDGNGDGDAMDPNEHWVFFDGSASGTHGGNLSGILMTSAQDLTVDAAGVVWVAASSTTSGGNDAVLRLQDLGGTPGANDVGEAREFATFAIGGATGDSIPTDVTVGPGGYIYYVENGATGVITRGIYRLHDDVVPNGHCNDPGEVSPFFLPPPQVGTAFHWGVTVDSNGAFYLADSGNELLWKVQDFDGNLIISPGAPEEALWWTSSSSSTIWRPAAASDGSVWCVESQTPDRILRMSDTVVPNGNVNDPGEVVTVYDETVASIAVGNPRSIAFARSPALLTDPSPAIGTTTTVMAEGRYTDFISVWYSTMTTNTPVAPFGVLGINLSPPAIAGELYSAAIPVSGFHTRSYPIPPAPGLIGFSLSLQAIGGRNARLELSNTVTITLR